jgi:low affinity Fe/Cu permease
MVDHSHRPARGSAPSGGPMPSEVSDDQGWFDRFAERASQVVSRAWFFAACVLLVVVWAPSYPLFGNFDTYQLIINSATTIVTFLLVALLQNATRRGDQSTQHKLNAIAAGLAELMRERSNPDEPDEQTYARVAAARRELVAAVGLEQRESA